MLHVELQHCASSATFHVKLWHCASSSNVVSSCGIVCHAMTLCIMPWPCASCRCIPHCPGMMCIIASNAHHPGTMRIVLGRCASFWGIVHCFGMMRIVPGQCTLPRNDAHCLAALQGFACQKEGWGWGVTHQKGELRIKKRGITHHAQCWHSCRAMALADGNLLSSFVAEKTKL